MKYNFDETRDRSKVGKWKQATELGAIGMGVADMDFRLIPEVARACHDCLEEGEFGYRSRMTDDEYGAVMDWLKYRDGIDVPRQSLLATPGVLYAARTSMYALSQPGDRIIVQTPLHTPSIATAAMQDRQRIVNPLICRDGDYFIDFDQLEDCFRQGARVMMLCAPNNPTGRVWTMEELKNIATLVNRYDAYLVSDEIHRDIIWEGHKHISPTELPELRDRSVAVFSTSKTFNMGGFHIGSAIIHNPELKERITKRFYEFGHACGRPTTLCIAAQTAAYRHGREWYEEMMRYVGQNIDMALDGLSDLPIRVKRPEATFLLWIDVSALGLRTMDLQTVMERDWKVLCERGIIYDTSEYADKNPLEHHIRMNLATTHQNVEEAIERIRSYFKKK